MSEFLLILTVMLPLILVAIWPARICRAWVGFLAAWVPIPAILLALLGNELAIELPWLLLGSRWGLDATGRVFLGFTATLWLAAGVYARSHLKHDPQRNRFELFWLVTLCGNLGVIVAQDMVSFLLFYTMMSLAAYGLITHDRQPNSLRASRTYIILSVFGEVLLFWAVILAAQETGNFYFEGHAARLAASPLRNVVVGLLLTGFGIKLGIMPLHFWLPLAHPAAPTPASAVLSGAIIKTGLLGLLRFLPLGAVALPEWGAVCVVVGISSAFIAALIGLTQDNPKTVLAYSSVSQMGLVAVGIGAAMMAPAAWSVIRIAILLFAVHHAVTKAALFLGVGIAQANPSSNWRRTLIVTGLIVAALALAGLPLTSGFVAKSGLKYAASATPVFWASTLQWTLPLTGITTTLLVTRFLFLLWPSRQQMHKTLTLATAISWGVLTTGVVVIFFALRLGAYVKPAWTSLTSERLWAVTWPVLAAAVLLLSLRSRQTIRDMLTEIRIPAGDLVVPLTLTVACCGRFWNAFAISGISTLVSKTRHRVTRRIASITRNALNRLARGLENDLAAGLLVGLLTVALFALILL